MTIEDRFKQFLSSLPGVELVDSLLPSGSFPNKRRADYLLVSRRVVVELKTLKVDTSSKIEKELARHRDRSDYPFMAGPVELPKILRHLPDGSQINHKLYRNISRSVEDAVRSAEAQIADTEQILTLGDSMGLLVLLNDNIEVLSPHVVTRRVSELLCRNRTNGEMCTPIDFVWLLFESHITQLPNGPLARPSILLDGPTASRFGWFIPVFNQLQALWANFNNAPLSHVNAERIAEISFRSANPENPIPPERLKRHEQWERRYEAAPYLRKLSDNEVLDHGAEVFRLLRPNFLKGGPRVSMEQLEPLFIRWSDFLQESKHRGLNLRDLQDRF